MKHQIVRAAIGIAAVIFTASCGDNSSSNDTSRKDGFSKDLKTKEDSLYHEVMEGHDVGMAKMGKISGAIKQVAASLDSLKKLKSPDQQKITTFESIAKDLNQADYSMNRWMEEFVLDSAKDNQPVRLQYLEAERDKISIIRDRILNSLKRADSAYGR